jgi:hypothetical protein
MGRQPRLQSKRRHPQMPQISQIKKKEVLNYSVDSVNPVQKLSPQISPASFRQDEQNRQNQSWSLAPVQAVLLYLRNLRNLRMSSCSLSVNLV